MEAEAAGSVAASESHSHTSGQEEESQQQNGSVNYTSAQSPRVPRSQISRAHPGHNAGYGERTSAVLSALSGDDETALSAAEAAGEHTSEPQDMVGGVGEAQGEGGGAASTALLPLPHQPAHSLTAPQPRRRHELASSPPASASPMYRANSVVSHTAAAPNWRSAQQPQHGQPPLRRGAETPASAPPAAYPQQPQPQQQQQQQQQYQQVVGSSPNTSRGEFSAALPQPRAPRRGGAFSAGASGLPPTSGQRPQQQMQQQQAAAAGPSRPSLSGTQSAAATAAASLPSTLAVALGAFSPPAAAGLLGQLAEALPSTQQPQTSAAAAYGAAGMAGLIPLAASIGLPPSQLNSVAAALLQAQTSVLGAAAQQHQSQQTPLGPAPPPSAGGAGSAMPPPPPLQALQQAEALQSMAAMLQAQASAIQQQAAAAQQQQQHPGAQQSVAPHHHHHHHHQHTHHQGGGRAATPASAAQGVMSSPGEPQQQQGHWQGQLAPAATPAPQAQAASEAGLQAAASVGAASVQSLPSLVGASAIQGHPLPPPFYAAAATTTPAPLQSFGNPAAAAGGAGPPTVHSVGAFVAPGPLALTPLHAVTPAAAPALSEMQGSAIQPALAAMAAAAQQQHPQQAQQAAHEVAQAPSAAAEEHEAGGASLAGPMQQAASAVRGGGGGGGGRGRGSGGSFMLRASPSDPDQRAAEEERLRHVADPPQPQAAVIQELPTADVAAASQGGGGGGGEDGGAQGGVSLPLAVPQEAAMLGGNSTCADAMELGADEEDDAMEVQQAAAGSAGGVPGEGQSGHLPPAPHGAASVMATVMTDGGRSDGDTEMQQTASGPSRNAKPAQSLSRSMAEPAAATAHNTRSGRHTGATATQPSQQGPATSNLGQVAHAPSSLATLSTGNEEGAGGSVEMSGLPSQQAAQQHATSAPACFNPAGAGAGAEVAPAAGLAGLLIQEGAAAAAAAAGAGGQAAAHAAGLPQPPGAGPQATLSAPAAMQPQQSLPAAVAQQQQQQGTAAQAAAAAAAATGMPAGQQQQQHQHQQHRTASVSMSGQGDTPGAACYVGTGGGAMPQSSAAAGPAGHQPWWQQQQQQTPFVGSGGGAAGQQQPQPIVSMCEGCNAAPQTDARSRSQGAAAAAAAAGGHIEGMGSPDASMLQGAAQPRESQGTARGTILAGAAHSILTTAAAGDGEAMDEGGEALSPLLAAKAAAQAAAAAAHHAGQTGMLPAATPGTGSVGGAPTSLLPAAGAGSSELAAPPSKGTGQQQQQHQQQQEEGGGAGGSGLLAHVHANGVLHHPHEAQQGFASPINLSTMAVDLAPADGEGPQPSASYQPSSLPPPGAVAAAVAAAEQQQAVQNGVLYHTPPPPLAGELYQALQQNGYATHANSVIGNGHMAHSSPERELTSPSRMLTHDSTGSGSQQQRSSKHTGSKRRRTSAGPAGSTQHA